MLASLDFSCSTSPRFCSFEKEHTHQDMSKSNESGMLKHSSPEAAKQTHVRYSCEAISRIQKSDPRLLGELPPRFPSENPLMFLKNQSFRNFVIQGM